MTMETRVQPSARNIWRNRIESAGNWAFGPIDLEGLGVRLLLQSIVLTLVGGVIAFLRLPPGTRNVLWAEDASVFVTGALQHQPYASLFEPYAGYMHAFPRLSTALVVTFVPMGIVPVALTAVACLLTSFIATVVVLMLRTRIPSILVRLTIWLGIVTLPIAGIEANGSVANSHWYLLVGLFAVLVSRQRQSVWIIIGSVVVAFAVTSDPLSAVFLPLVIGRFILIREPRDAWIPSAYMFFLIMQLLVVATTTIGPAAIKPTATEVIRTTGFRVFLAALTGENGSASLYVQFGASIIAIATVIVLSAVGVTLIRGNQLGGLALVSTVVAVVFFVADAIIRWNSQYDPKISTTWGGSRYSVLPISLILIALGCAVSVWSLGRWRLQIIRQVAPLALLLLVGVIAVPAFSFTARYPADSWTNELLNAKTICSTSSNAHEVRIPAAPTKFVVTASCGSLGF